MADAVETRWFLRTGSWEKRRFLTGILLRCADAALLSRVHDVLHATRGKDVTYARSRPGVRGPGEREEGGDSREPEMRDTWDWFGRCPVRTQTQYLMGILSQCDMELLRMMGNLARVLLVRQRTFSRAQDASEPESSHSFHSDDDPDLELLVQASSVYGPVDVGSMEAGEMKIPEGTCFSPELLTRLGESTSGEILTWSLKPDLKSLRSVRRDLSGCEDLVDPALTVVARSSRSLSGVGLYRDFIRALPVHLAKRILGLLDAPTLHRCLRVSLHWGGLAKEVQEEAEVAMKRKMQAKALQGNSISRASGTITTLQDVLVPVGDGTLEDDSSYRGGAFSSVYCGVKTRPVQMEERDVYRGLYNVLVLQDRLVVSCGQEWKFWWSDVLTVPDRDDAARVVHSTGQQLVAISSKQHVVQLINVASLRVVPPEFRGHAGSIRALLLCEERGLVLSAGYDLTIRCWDLQSGSCTMLLRGHLGSITCLDLHGDVLVSGARDCRVKVWDLQTGRCDERLRFRHGRPVLSVKVSEVTVVSGCSAGQVKMWSLETASLLKLVGGHQGPVRCVALDQWHILTGGSDGLAVAWSRNCRFKKCLMKFQHPKEVTTLSFLSLRLVTGCTDGKIRIFHFLTGQCLRVMKASGHPSPVLSIHTHSDSMVVNTRSSLMLLQFYEKDGASSSEHHSRTDRGGNTTRGEPVRSRHGRRRWTAPLMQREKRTQQDPVRTAPWAPCQNLYWKWADQHADFIAHHPSCISAGRPLTAFRKSSMAARDLLLSRSEEAVLARVERRGTHHPPTLDRILLKAGVTQQTEARINMEHNTRLRDAWGPDGKTPPLSTKPRPSPNQKSRHAAVHTETKSCCPLLTIRHGQQLLSSPAHIPEPPYQ
ncbi:CMT1A duplicated region transcript 1 protein-like isoform X2 [Denticeps clupeoides]|uniref:CMT1A duplicated region transcript 1 protein-like isoform X2 n=1 Tax=Denticeps clupeoides TaxID=299321 RepID=UPI0010A3315A|nr:CMT1A duplicated region transcript 1 protein-like isoform X2 [Denticeps clupeoides]